MDAWEVTMAIEEIKTITLTVRPKPAVINCDAKAAKKFEFEVEMTGKAEATGGEGTLSVFDKKQEQKDAKGTQEKDKDTGALLYKDVGNTQKTPKIEPNDVKNGEFTKTSKFELSCEANCTISGVPGSKSKAEIFARMKFADPNKKWHAAESNSIEVECKKGS
jgi:hypothetical protein